MLLAASRALAFPATTRGNSFRHLFNSPLARSKHTLPALAYDYGALEPAISAEIMELHHSKHHQAYVNGLNAAEESMRQAIEAGDVRKAIELQPALRFNGGGHINHTLFWESLAPEKSGGGRLNDGTAPILHGCLVQNA
ncbi:Superoxide dismutase [Mn], mitochondrial [Cystobasidiomycetes sp. EMM_F5]